MELNKIKYFDIHSHLHDENFFSKQERKDIILKMEQEKIFTILIGTDFSDSKQSSKISLKSHNLFSSIGQHPVDNKEEKFEENKYQKIFEQNKNKIVCVGECGLDFFWPKKDLEKGNISQKDFLEEAKRQKTIFEKQIYFAQKNNLPLMLHVRSFEKGDAHKEAFKILDQKQKEFDQNNLGKIRANFHFFTESLNIAEEIIKRNFSISLPGVITFANLDKIIEKIPLKNLMSETDSPFATPTPFRGETNNPLYIKEIVKKIAQIKNISQEECREQLKENAINFFEI